MSLLERKQLIEYYKPESRPKVKRTPDSYIDMREVTVRALVRLIDEYESVSLGNGIQARWYRDNIDWAIKRYQKYCIEQNIGSHYYQTGISLQSRNVTVEHVIPETVIRSMLLDNMITIDQAINSPICRVSKQFDRALSNAGLVKSSSNPWVFFSRYTSAAKFAGMSVPNFETYNGQVIDPTVWGLFDHCTYFGIALD